MSEIVDLRGRQRVAATAPVLADPSGRRAQALARMGRVVAVLFLAWLVGLMLAGLGILPASDLPLGHTLAPQSPPSLARLPRPVQPRAADLLPARPLAPPSPPASGHRVTRPGVSSPTVAQRRSAHRILARRLPHSPAVINPAAASPTVGKGHATVPVTSHRPAGGGSGSAPASGGGRSGSSPGHTKTHRSATPTTSTSNGSGRSTSAPGHVGGVGIGRALTTR
jgi:hypothetical protein